MYVGVLYIGTRRDDVNFGYSFCTVVKCADGECGSLEGNYLVESEFTTLKLSGNFPMGATVYATVVSDKLQLLNPAKIETGPKSLSIKEVKVLSATLWTRNVVGLDYCEEDSCS